MKKISGVYKITSILKPERIYIGSASNIYKRWQEHLCALKGRYHHSKKLQRHSDKYGKNDLQFSILIGCEIEELISSEQYFIDSYNPYFNCCRKAGSTLGRKASEETKAKMRLRKGPKNPMYGTTWNQNQIDASKRPKSEETRKNISIGQRKRFDRPEEKIKAKERGLKRGPFGQAKGWHHTEESKKKNSESNKGRVAWNKGQKASVETIRKQTEARRKRPLYSEETKQKMRESGLKAWELRRLNCFDELKKKMSESAKKREELKRLKKQIIIQSPSLCN